MTPYMALPTVWGNLGQCNTQATLVVHERESRRALAEPVLNGVITLTSSARRERKHNESTFTPNQRTSRKGHGSNRTF